MTKAWSSTASFSMFPSPLPPLRQFIPKRPTSGRCNFRSRRPSMKAELPRADPALDDILSKRPLTLDANGYFVIYLSDRHIIVEYYTNTIDKNGLACDPDTGEVIPCTAGYKRVPSASYKGISAKQLSVQIIEQEGRVTRLEHANYLGRELQKAEFALLLDQTYTQDQIIKMC